MSRRSIATLRTSVAVRACRTENAYGQRAVAVGLNSRSRFRDTYVYIYSVAAVRRGTCRVPTTTMTIVSCRPLSSGCGELRSACLVPTAGDGSKNELQLMLVAPRAVFFLSVSLHTVVVYGQRFERALRSWRDVTISTITVTQL